MDDEMDNLFCDIFNECQRGFRHSRFSYSLRDRLEAYESNVRKEIVSRLDENDTAPLFHACLAGKEKMVEYLIWTCDADVEQKGYWDDINNNDLMVSPLWCAAACCRKPIIECLVRHGGEVNAVSNIGTTPVQAACSRFDIDSSDVVEYLVKHGADIHRANDHDRTCLMVAVRNVQMCEFLLKHGVDVDATNTYGETALHYAIAADRLDTVKLLLDYGADATQRSLGNDDALQAACLVGSQPIFDYLVEHGSYSPGRLADANELMGSCRFHDRETALEYWRKAIVIRNANAVDGTPLAKTPSMPKRDCYRNVSEFESLDELDAIALDWDAMVIQKLLIHERILGERHRSTFEELNGMGTSYIDSLRYRNGFDLWRRALEISTVNDSISWVNVDNTAREFVIALYDLHEGIPLDVADPNRVNEEQARFADVMAVFKLLTSRLVRAQPPSERELLTMYREESCSYNGILRCITYLIDLLVKTARTREAEDEVRALVRHLVNRNPMSLRTDDTLLHLCVSRHYNTYSGMQIFPNLEVTTLLLECEADVNARNKDGRTPLHIASRSENFSDQMVKLLLDHGAHLDTPDKSGSTPAHMLSAKPDNTVDLGNYMTLRCLAAQAIVKYEIQCNGLPASMNQFVDLHRRPL